MGPVELAFWVAMMVLAFLAFLGLQLRYFAGMALRIYVGNRLKQATKGEVDAVILNAVGGRRAPFLEQAHLAAEAEHLRQSHPRPLSQIRVGRTVSLVTPFVIAVCLVAWRFWPV